MDKENKIIFIDGKNEDNEISKFENLQEFKREIKQVFISDKMKSIKQYAFENFTSLNSIIIPSSIQTIEKDSFKNNNLTYIKYEGYSNNDCKWNISENSLTEAVNVPIEYNNKKFCEQIAITNGSCGYNCTWIYNHETQELEIFGSGKMNNYGVATEIPWYPKMSQIKIIRIFSILTIVNNAFNGAKALETIQFHENIQSIGNSAFSSCTGLKQISLPTNLQTIGEKVFEKCSNIEYIEYPIGLKKCNSNVFSTSKTWKTIKFIGKGEMQNYTEINQPWHLIKDQIVKIEFDENVESIGNYAFSGLTSLKEVEIHKNIIFIGEKAFSSSGLLTISR